MRPLLFCHLVTTIVLGHCAGTAMAGAPAGRNLLPNADLGPVGAAREGALAGWTVWSPRPSLAPEGGVVKREGVPALSLRADRYEQIGKWMTLVPEVKPGKHYRFEGLHQTEGVASDAASVVFVVTWCRTVDGEGELQRDYVLTLDSKDDWTRRAQRPAGQRTWRKSARTIQAPPEAQAARVELILRWAPGAPSIGKT